MPFDFVYATTKNLTTPTISPDFEKELLISAAISLKEVISSVGKEFTQRYPKTKILYNFAASGQLRTQIENGAPVDVIFTASIKDIDLLIRKDLILNNHKKTFTKNKLVLITSNSNQLCHSLFDLQTPKIKSIAIGNPSTVPGGKYAEESFSYLHLLPAIKEKLVLTENVRQVLDYVSRNEVDAGVVFYTDTLTNKKVKIIASFPEDSHQPIIYPVAIIKSSSQAELAKKFVEFATATNGKKILKQHGFITNDN